MKDVIEMVKEAGGVIEYVPVYSDGCDKVVAGVYFNEDELKALLTIHKEELLDELRAAPVAWITTYGRIRYDSNNTLVIQPICARYPIPLYALPEKESEK